MSSVRLKRFRYFVQKVLPLVYDDSLSYYEVLDKVVVALNNCIDALNAGLEVVDNMESTVAELQSQVTELYQLIDNLIIGQVPPITSEDIDYAVSLVVA